MLVALFPSFSRLFRTARDESWAGPGNETISCWIYMCGVLIASSPGLLTPAFVASLQATRLGCSVSDINGCLFKQICQAADRGQNTNLHDCAG